MLSHMEIARAVFYGAEAMAQQLAERRVGARRARAPRLPPADGQDLQPLRGDRADAGRGRLLLRAGGGRPREPRGAPVHRPLRARARGRVGGGAHRAVQAGVGRDGRDVRAAHGAVRALLLRRSDPAHRRLLHAVRQGAAASRSSSARSAAATGQPLPISPDDAAAAVPYQPDTRGMAGTYAATSLPTAPGKRP